MKSIKFKRVPLLMISIFIVSFLACEYEGPEAVWNPDPQSAPKPIVNSIDPADSAVAGNFFITLNGENFSEELTENLVIFYNVNNFYQVVNGSGGELLEQVQAEVRNASSNSITVYRPNIIGDSCLIKVSVQDAYHIETFGSPYRVTTVSSEYVRLAIGETINAMAVDNQENLYLYMGDSRTIHKVTPEGERTEYADVGAASIVSMRMGPEGNLYLSRTRYKSIYFVVPDGTVDLLDDFPEKVSYFDFDENLNIFAGGRESNLIIRNQDGIFKDDPVGDYEDFEILCIRIFNGYVYVATEYRGDLDTVPLFAIWKSEIIDDPDDADVPVTVGAKELFLDWSQSGDDFSDSQILDITFSALEAGGDCFVGTSNGASDEDDSTDPILIIHSDGSFEPLYKGGLLLPENNEPDATKMVWGSTEYMYVYNSVTETVNRLGMNRDGAPYYGRE